MSLGFKVSGRIAKPVAEVFDAVVNPAKLSGYFTTLGGAARHNIGRLTAGGVVDGTFNPGSPSRIWACSRRWRVRSSPASWSS